MARHLMQPAVLWAGSSQTQSYYLLNTCCSFSTKAFLDSDKGDILLSQISVRMAQCCVGRVAQR